MHRLLSNLTNEQGLPASADIYVVCSGCTDETVPIVKDVASKDHRIQLILEEERRGQASAVNKVLSLNKHPFIVLINADTVPGHGSIARLVEHAANDGVGLVGGWPVILNAKTNYVSGLAAFAWSLTKRVMHGLNGDGALDYVSGEMFCVKAKVVHRLPADLVNHDAYFALMSQRRRLRVKVDEQARVYLKVPTVVTDYLAQRRRIVFGHYQMQARFRILPSAVEGAVTRFPSMAVKCIAEELQLRPRSAFFIPGSIILDGLAFVLGLIDFLRGRDYSVWPSIRSSK